MSFGTKKSRKRSDKDTPLSLRPADPWLTFFNEGIPWHKLPDFLGLIRLFRIRDLLRKRNLHDTSQVASPALQPPDSSVRHLDARTPDGAFNDLDNPRI